MACRAASIQVRLAELLSSDLALNGNASCEMVPGYSIVSLEPSDGPLSAPANGTSGHLQVGAEATNGTAVIGSRRTGSTSFSPAFRASFHNPLAAASLRGKPPAAPTHHKSGDVPQMVRPQSTAFDSVADDSSTLFVPGQGDGRSDSFVPEEIVRAAAAQNSDPRVLSGVGAQARMHLSRQRSARTSSMRKAVRDAEKKARDAELAYSAAEAIENIEESNQRGLRWRRSAADQGNRTDTRLSPRCVAACPSTLRYRGIAPSVGPSGYDGLRVSPASCSVAMTSAGVQGKLRELRTGWRLPRSNPLRTFTPPLTSFSPTSY